MKVAKMSVDRYVNQEDVDIPHCGILFRHRVRGKPSFSAKWREFGRMRLVKEGRMAKANTRYIADGLINTKASGH